MSAINVLKFGGSSVSNNENLKIVANKIIKIKKTGVNVVVVVSAQGKRTDELIKQVEELSTLNENKREIDSLLVIGEQESASKLSILLNEMGYKSIALNALQAGIFTNSDFGKAKIIDIDTKRILKELENGKIVIVTGFQGIDKEKNFTTLGRGGSDTSAVALAIKLNAEKCYIFSDVDGVYNADPNIIKNAKKLKHISYSEMENAASEGAKVLCERSISLADKYNMEIIAKSTFNDNEGTIISNSKSTFNGNEETIMSNSNLTINGNEGTIISNSNSTFNDNKGMVISEFGMEHYKLEMCIKNDKLFKAEISDVSCEKLNTILDKINKQNIKIKNLSMQNNKNVIFIVNEYFKDDIKNIFKDEKLKAEFTKISEISFIGTGISNNGEILASLFKILEKYKYNLMNDVLNFEMRANVISIFFSKLISNDLLNELIK